MFFYLFLKRYITYVSFLLLYIEDKWMVHGWVDCKAENGAATI